MIIIILLWFLLIIVGGKREKNCYVLGKEQTLAIRGICATEIMIGHIGGATGDIILFPNRKAGILFVGIFFLLSGYGLALSTDKKVNYIDAFLVKKTISIILPSYIVYVGYILLRRCFFIGNIKDIFNLKNFFVMTNWYVWEQYIFYILFYFFHRRLRRLYRDIAILIISIIFIALAFCMGLENPWYGSTLCFPLGLFFYQFEKQRHLVSKDKKVILFIIMCVLLSISLMLFFFLGNDSILGNPIGRNVASLSFCILVLLVLTQIRIGNRLSYYLGKYSYEIFLIHPFVQLLLKGLVGHFKIIYSIMVIGITIVLARILHKLLKLKIDNFTTKNLKRL